MLLYHPVRDEIIYTYATKEVGDGVLELYTTYNRYVYYYPYKQEFITYYSYKIHIVHLVN